MYRQLIIVSLILFLLSCKRKELLVLSKYPTGEKMQVMELDKPITQDSVGIRTIFYKDGQIKEVGQFRNNKPQGLWKSYDENGKIQWEATFKNGINDGYIKNFGENGGWTETNYKNGMKEGKYVSYFYDYWDSIYCFVKGQYVADLEEGLWVKTGNSNINLVEMHYEKGKPIGYLTNRFKNGNLKVKAKLDSSGNLKDFTFYDSLGKPSTDSIYTIRKI